MSMSPEDLSAAATSLVIAAITARVVANKLDPSDLDALARAIEEICQRTMLYITHQDASSAARSVQGAVDIAIRVGVGNQA